MSAFSWSTLAPTTRWTSLPSLKKTNVGIASTLYSWETASAWSTSTLMNTTLPLNSPVLQSSILGAMRRQGPHHLQSNESLVAHARESTTGLTWRRSRRQWVCLCSSRWWIHLWALQGSWLRAPFSIWLKLKFVWKQTRKKANCKIITSPLKDGIEKREREREKRRKMSVGSGRRRKKSRPWFPRPRQGLESGSDRSLSRPPTATIAMRCCLPLPGRKPLYISEVDWRGRTVIVWWNLNLIRCQSKSNTTLVHIVPTGTKKKRSRWIIRSYYDVCAVQCSSPKRKARHSSIVFVPMNRGCPEMTVPPYLSMCVLPIWNNISASRENHLCFFLSRCTRSVTIIRWFGVEKRDVCKGNSFYRLIENWIAKKFQRRNESGLITGS